jgi:hypothetical protein
VGKECVKTGVVVLVFTEGEDVRSPPLQPQVQLAVGKLEGFLDMDLVVNVSGWTCSSVDKYKITINIP